jgi:WD40 repeat protein
VRLGTATRRGAAARLGTATRRGAAARLGTATRRGAAARLGPTARLGAPVLLAAALLLPPGCAKREASEGQEAAPGARETPRHRAADPRRRAADPRRRSGSARSTAGEAKTVARVPPAKAPRWRRRAAYGGFYSAAGVGHAPTGQWVLAHRRGVDRFVHRSGQRLGRIGHEDGGAVMALRPDGRQVALGHSRGRVQLLDLESQAVTELPKLDDWVQDVAFGPQGKRLAAVSQDGRLRIYDVSSGKAVHTLDKVDRGLYSVAFHPDGDWLVAGGYQLHRVDPGQGRVTKSWAQSSSPYRSLSFSPKGERLAAATKNQVQVLDAASGEAKQTLAERRSPAAYGPKGRWLALGTKQGGLALRDLRQERAITTFRTKAPPWRLAFAPDGQALAVVHRSDSTLHVYQRDGAPDLGLWLPKLSWYDDPDGPTLYVTVQVVGALPARSVAYGKLTGLKAVDDQGRPVKKVTASSYLGERLKLRDRTYPGTSPHGFELELEVHGVPADAKRLARLEGTFRMHAANQSKDLVFEDVASRLGRPLAHPVLKAASLRVTVERKAGGKGLKVSYEGVTGQLEDVFLMSPEGKRRTLSQQRIAGNPPTWSSSRDPAKLAGWKLHLRVNPALEPLQGRLRVDGIVLPPREK